MKRIALLMIIPYFLTGFPSCAGMPIKFSASYDIHAEGMEKPIRLEVGYWNVTMAGKETREVQPQ
jgi:hypothetical protein